MQITFGPGSAWKAALWAGAMVLLVVAPGAAISQTKGLKSAVVVNGAGANRCLAIQRASRSRGKNAVIADCHGKKSQQWVRTPGKQLQVRHSGLCLEILNSDKKRGAAVIQSACLKSKNQQWYVTAKGEIRSKLNHMCLSVPTGGSRITMNGCNGSASQIWTLQAK